MIGSTDLLHPEFPLRFWVVIEQPRHEPFRYSYDPVSNTFVRTGSKSLLYDRGFDGAYGWIGGSGEPPQPHFDVILITHQDVQPGAVVLGHLCGMFRRGDGDHKFVAVDDERLSHMPAADLSGLDPAQRANLLALYPQIGAGEGWFGRDEAAIYLRTHRPAHD